MTIDCIDFTLRIKLTLSFGAITSCFFFVIPHKIFVGFKSSELASQEYTLIWCWVSHSSYWTLTFWQDDKSCWKIKSLSDKSSDDVIMKFTMISWYIYELILSYVTHTLPGPFAVMQAYTITLAENFTNRLMFPFHMLFASSAYTRTLRSSYDTQKTLSSHFSNHPGHIKAFNLYRFTLALLCLIVIKGFIFSTGEWNPSFGDVLVL